MAKKDPIGVRFTDEERLALEAAGEEKSLPMSALVRTIVAEWLRKNGWLRKAKK